jgi:hypothetical protein
MMAPHARVPAWQNLSKVSALVALPRKSQWKVLLKIIIITHYHVLSTAVESAFENHHHKALSCRLIDKAWVERVLLRICALTRRRCLKRMDTSSLSGVSDATCEKTSVANVCVGTGKEEGGREGGRRDGGKEG